MGLLFGSIFTFIVAVFGIIFGLLGLLIGAVLRLTEFLLAGPFIIVLVIMGLIFWQPLLWLVILLVVFYIYRINKKKRYIKINRK